MSAPDEPKPGTQHDLPNEAYHSGPGISNSGLTDLARSPAHYYALHLDPKRPPREAKAGQLEGTLAHCAILEPGEFARRYVVGPNVRRGTKAWDEFEAANPGKVAIKQEQFDTAHAQAAAVRALPDVAALLSIGRSEVSAYWVDQATGHLCRCRPDWVHPVNDDSVILLDVKTYSDASPAEFARQVARKRYHVQDAFYSDGFEHASQKRVVGFVFVAVEDKWPFAACACMLDDDGREKGRVEYRRLLELYARCRATGVWPGYSDTVEVISLPSWAA